MFSGPWGQASHIAPIFWGFLQNRTTEVLESDIMLKLTSLISTILAQNNVPEPHPKPDQILLCIIVPFFTLVTYFIIFGKRHRAKRSELQEELQSALEKVQDLEDKLMLAEEEERQEGKEIRIWMDGAFDMFHYGHMNAFRQGKALGTYLVVGVNCDKTITECKGKPLMNDRERSTAVMGCKFVNEIVERAFGNS